MHDQISYGREGGLRQANLEFNLFRVLVGLVCSLTRSYVSECSRDRCVRHELSKVRTTVLGSFGIGVEGLRNHQPRCFRSVRRFGVQ